MGVWSIAPTVIDHRCEHGFRVITRATVDIDIGYPVTIDTGGDKLLVPCNRHLLVEPEEKDQNVSGGVVLPDGYKC